LRRQTKPISKKMNETAMNTHNQTALKLAITFVLTSAIGVLYLAAIEFASRGLIA
jgi:hypothetical protein